MKLNRVVGGTAIFILAVLCFLSGMLLERNTAALEILTIETRVVNHPDYYNSINYRGSITVDQALEYIRECRYWHVEWLTWQEKYGDNTTASSAGGIEWHRKWVERYEQVITLLTRK